MACLLSQTEYLIWERRWKRSLRELLDTYANKPQLAALTMDHLCGQGARTKPQEQAANIPEPALRDVKQAALAALQSIPAAVFPMAHFTQVVQGRTEPFINFVE